MVLCAIFDQPNRMREFIGDGAMWVLVDLFMMEEGPGLRGKLCHGEADFSTMFDSGPILSNLPVSYFVD
jgi:hypothetical protein